MPASMTPVSQYNPTRTLNSKSCPFGVIKGYKGVYGEKNGKGNGNYYIMIGRILGYIGIMEESAETTLV